MDQILPPSRLTRIHPRSPLMSVIAHRRERIAA